MAFFLARARHWILYRLTLRAPRLMAMATRELPLRAAVGVYTEAPPRDEPIPNVVYQTWIEPLFGRSHVAELARFRALNPDHSFRFFDEAEIEAYMIERWADHPIFPVFQGALFGPLKTDIWRYCILFDRGGAYCDIGKSITTPLCALIPRGADCVISWELRGGGSPFEPSSAAAERLQHPRRVMMNWALIFSPRHPLLRRVIDGIVAKYPNVRNRPQANIKDAILRFTGPLHLTECLLAAAEAGELQRAHQAGIEFGGQVNWGLDGAWVRYMGRPAYILARNQPIVR